MNLKPQDVLFLLKLVASGKKSWSFNKIADELGMSASEVHAAAKRAMMAKLALKEGEVIAPNVKNLEEFLLHGIQYVFIPEQGGVINGMLTGCASVPISAHLVEDHELPLVWPDPEGKVRGESFSPLYKSAPKAAKNDPQLYQLLVLVDAIRSGRAGVRDLAKKELKSRLTTSTRKKGKSIMGDKNKVVISNSIIVSRSELQELAQHYHIHRLVLFGSAARGELRADSDIDLLIEFENGSAPSLGGMVEIKEAFTKLFNGRKVDVATPSILNNPYRKRAIEKDMKELYAA